MSLIKKSKIYLIFIILFFPFTLSYKTEQVIAEYDSETQTLIYKGNLYILSPSPTEPLILKAKETKYESKESKEGLSGAEFWFYLIVAIALVCFAGAMSGLTVGYLSIDTLILELKISNGTEIEKYYAKKILSIVSNHHWLLVTLLLCNSFAAEYMPIVLDKLVSELMAVILSVTLLLFVGEIIPQAACTGPNQMKIASFLAPFTYFLMVITYPVSYPIALLMDWIIGTHGKSRFCNSDLRTLIKLHTVDALKNFDVVDDEYHQDSEIKDLKEGEKVGLSKEQVNYMVGALDISSKKAFDIMIPIEKTTLIDYNSTIDRKFIQNLLTKGFSRIPVYLNDRDNIIGILRIKQLIGIDISRQKTIKDLKITLSSPLIISKNMLAMDLLTEFRKGRSHMAFITESSNVEKLQRRLGLDTNNSLRDYTILSKLEKGDNKGNYVKILGIVTIEDVLEKMFNIEILDEDDYNKGKKKDNLKKVLTKQITQSFIDKNKSYLNDMFDQSNKDTIMEDNNTYGLDEDYILYKDEKQKNPII